MTKVLSSLFFGLISSTLLLSCCSKNTPSKKLITVEPSYQVQGYENNRVDSLSEFILEHPKHSLKVSPDVKIDFKNFVYKNEFILHNGLSYMNEDGGFDTIRHIASHNFGNGLTLVELYESYGGGSSEIFSILYLYRRVKNELVLLSSLSGEGYFPLVVKGNKIKVKANNYQGGESARCCPWKYEIAEFEVTKNGLKYIGHSFEDIPD